MKIDYLLKASQDVWKCFETQENICQMMAHQLGKELDVEDLSNVEKVGKFFTKICETDEGMDWIFSAVKKHIGIDRIVSNSLGLVPTWSFLDKITKRATKNQQTKVAEEKFIDNVEINGQIFEYYYVIDHPNNGYKFLMLTKPSGSDASWKTHFSIKNGVASLPYEHDHILPLTKSERLGLIKILKDKLGIELSVN